MPFSSARTKNDAGFTDTSKRASNVSVFEHGIDIISSLTSLCLSIHRFSSLQASGVSVVRNYAVGEEWCERCLNNFTHVQGLSGYDGNFYTDPKGLMA